MSSMSQAGIERSVMDCESKAICFRNSGGKVYVFAEIGCVRFVSCVDDGPGKTSSKIVGKNFCIGVILKREVGTAVARHDVLF